MSAESGCRFRDEDMRKTGAKAHGANLKGRDAGAAGHQSEVEAGQQRYALA
jgi:hypothetical protein